MLYFSKLKADYIAEHEKELKGYAIDMEISTHLFFLEVLCRAKGTKYRKSEKNSIRLVRSGYKTYHSNNKHEKNFAGIVYFGLYPVYKLLFKIRKNIRRIIGG